MTTLTDQLQIIPPARGMNARGRLALTLTYPASSSPRLFLSRKAVAALGAPKAVAIALSRHKIGVMAVREGDARGRRVYATGEVSITDLATVLGLKPGERFVCDVEVVDGSLLADWPAALFVRRQHAERARVTPIDGKASA